MGKRLPMRTPVEARVPVLGEVQLGTPIPMQGRRNKLMQTEVIMKELLHFGDTSDAQCQTEPFINHPPKPFLIMAKTGLDMATQVLPEELFDFDVEVSAPVVVLVEKVVEQSLMEVMEEEELASLWEQQNELLEKRMAERAEEERLEEAERRNREEKEKQMKLKEEKLNLEKEALDKLACHVFSSRYLSSLIPAVFGCLTENGYFYDTIERDVEFGFLPWLMSSTEERLELDVAARTIIDHLLCKEVHRRLWETENHGESTQPQDDEDFEEVSIEIDDVDTTETKPEVLDSDTLLTEDEEEEN